MSTTATEIRCGNAYVNLYLGSFAFVRIRDNEVKVPEIPALIKALEAAYAAAQLQEQR
ncbi:hypothetical protein NIIDNTM18_41940 [Mycolicibacterium litorale]|uniref:Uncharacterized protein n=1 Tax=Mycolicibacterium litorale TaxID=758802 RepID=A0A6S6PAA5_9MYCO|nr:hypothetical protein NIIDNTM18_41940 [Mycolicibacterium litorale]